MNSEIESTDRPRFKRAATSSMSAEFKRQRETLKVIQAHGEMSNLVHRFANITADGKYVQTVYIYGKADSTRFIVQAISALSGEPNVMRLFTLDQMLEWHFYDTLALAEDEGIWFIQNGKYRFNFCARSIQ